MDASVALADGADPIDATRKSLQQQHARSDRHT
jgi:hypothetical protein